MLLRCSICFFIALAGCAEKQPNNIDIVVNICEPNPVESTSQRDINLPALPRADGNYLLKTRSPAILERAFGFAPCFIGGEQVGYRLYSEEKWPGYLEANGFLDGDVITKVGDFQLTSQKQAVRALRWADRVPQTVNVVFLRNGVEMRVTKRKDEWIDRYGAKAFTSEVNKVLP